MKKLNNKGFVLVETLIVSVFLVTIFSILYNNFYPLMGEYERRESFDDIDSKYAIYWIKRMVQDSYYNLDKTAISNNKYVEFSCNNFSDTNKKAICNETIKRVSTTQIYIIDFITVNFKNKIRNNSSFKDGIRDYVLYLPEYTIGSLNGAQYRLVAEFHNTKDDNDFYTYATIEVKK